MTPGEIINMLVSGVCAVVMLFVRSEMQKMRADNLDREIKMREWVRENFQPQGHRERG